MFSKWVFCGFVYFLLGFLNLVEFCSGGITSSYVRNDDLSLDMPLDSDVFRVPPGYNAPQQVCNYDSSSASFKILCFHVNLFVGFVLGSYSETIFL